MKIQAKLKLKLEKHHNIIVIESNTLEPATFDQYLIASLMKNSKNKDEAFEYIDELTGNGSLNSHFKRMFEEIDQLDSSDINGILSNSLYPVLRIDRSNQYTYYPRFDISVMKNREYEGNIGEKSDFSRMLLSEGEFRSSYVENKGSNITSEPYFVKISEEGISFLITKNKEVALTEELLHEIVDSDVDLLSDFQGVIHEEIEGDKWNLMSKSKLQDISQLDSRNYLNKGNHFQIANKYLKRTKVSKVFGIPLYKETYLSYEKRNRKFCIDALEHLSLKDELHLIKDTAMKKLLSSIKLEESKKYVSLLLENKESKELSELGFTLLSKGMIESWSEGAKNNFKKFMKSDSEIVLTYKVSSDLDFTLTDLMKIYRVNREVLSEDDLVRVEKERNDLTIMINEINNIIGGITNSGRRELTRKLKNTGDVKKYRKLSHKLQGHVKQDIEKVSPEKIRDWHEDVLEYQRLDYVMIKLLEEQNIK